MKHFIPVVILLAGMLQGCASPPLPPDSGFSDDPATLSSPVPLNAEPTEPAPPPNKETRTQTAPTPRPSLLAMLPLAASSAPTANEPRLRPGIQVSIEVMTADRKEISEPQKRVSATGTITLPLIGTVGVDGMTVEELCANLTARYSAYLRAPVVDVTLMADQSGDETSPWGYVTVLGRVKNPGRISIPPTQDLTISMAIQLAGGLDTSAKETDIRVQRRGNGNSQTFRVDLRQIGTGGDAALDIMLLDGDVVHVPERIF